MNKCQNIILNKHHFFFKTKGHLRKRIFLKKHFEPVRSCKVVRNVYLEEEYTQREFLAKPHFIDKIKLHKVFVYII